MFKKAAVYIILLSMTLHCGCRLGVFDQAYQMRFHIAYTVGLIEEVQIAMCNSDYDFGRGIKIESVETDASMPISALAHEITLFYIAGLQMPVRERVLFKDFNDSYNNRHYQDHPNLVFHPPAIS